jgi:hypothetical protein
MIVLFLNHRVENCGVYQYGYRLFQILQKSTLHQYVYLELETFEEYSRAIEEHRPMAIIYNYHVSTMPWLTKDSISSKQVVNIGIAHDSPDSFFDVALKIDPTNPETDNTMSIPRPIYENIQELLATHQIRNESVKSFIDYNEGPDVPIYGSFGFGFLNKGFDSIVQLINTTHPQQRAIIKLVITFAHFDPKRAYHIATVNRLCQAKNTNPNIKLLIRNDFFSNEEILLFLASNTANVFLYDRLETRGISSVIDYAISANKPFVISNSVMFRNVYSDDICVFRTPLLEAIENSNKMLPIFQERYSHHRMIEKMDHVMTSIESNLSFVTQLSAAFYGNPARYPFKPNATIEVKKLFFGYVFHQNNPFQVCNEHFGDPCFGQSKRLTLTFLSCNRAFFAEEGEFIDWPSLLQRVEQISN